MNKKKLVLFLLAGMAVGLWMAKNWEGDTYEDVLIRVAAENKLGHIDKQIAKEPVEILSLLLEYSEESELVLKAWIAIAKYGDSARRILSTYGEEKDFQEILKTYGEAVVPVICYFLENDVLSVRIQHSVSQVVEKAKDWASNLWRRITGDKEPEKESSPPSREFTPEHRGLYAIKFIKDEGHHFLGQFVIDKEGKARWLQTDRVAQGISSLFVGGLREVEAKAKRGDEIGLPDVFWGSLDGLVLAAGTAKAIKFLKAAKGVKRLEAIGRGTLIASRTAAQARLWSKVLKWGKWGAGLLTVYMLAKHPELVNTFLGEVAKTLGMKPWVVQLAFWTLVIMIFLYPAYWLIKKMTAILYAFTSWVDNKEKK
ncbi:MAG: hypothetical protein QXS68_08550, partial [Candidatus Methanomethylicaceae archaeon]